jgi:hypothetical protein
MLLKFFTGVIKYIYNTHILSNSGLGISSDHAEKKVNR